MTRIGNLLENLEISLDDSINRNVENTAKTAFLSQLDKFGYEGVKITSVEYDPMFDSILFDFKDDDGDEMSLLLGFDEDKAAYAIALDDDDDPDLLRDEDEVDVIDLEAALPEHIYVMNDLVEFEWLTGPILVSLLKAGSIGEDDYIPPTSVDERKVAVIRGGKKVKLTVKRRVKKKRLSSKQKQALKKARRKANTGSAKRNRKKSMKLRKRTNLKSSNLKSRQKLGA